MSKKKPPANLGPVRVILEWPIEGKDDWVRTFRIRESAARMLADWCNWAEKYWREENDGQ